MKIKLTALAITVLMLLGIICSFSAFADDKPSFVLSADKTEVNTGDTLTLTLSIQNGAGLSCGDLAFEYNKNCLEFIDAKQTQESSDAGVMWVFPSAQDLGLTAQAVVKLSFIHMTEIAAKDANLAQIVFTFKAIGGGSCRFPLQTTGIEVAAGGEDTSEVAVEMSAVDVSIAGEAAPAWDYTYKMTEVRAGDAAADSSRRTKIIIIVVVAAIVIAVVVALVISLNGHAVREETKPVQKKEENSEEKK